MSYKKKVVCILIVLVMLGSSFSGCSSSGKNVIELSEENTTATYEDVIISFSPYDLENDSKVEINSVEPEPIISDEDLSEEMEIVAYDFNLQNNDGIIDLVDITLPYNSSFIDEGQKEDNCVAAMYFNEETNEWQPIDYTVDSENNVINITTSHLSTYGVFVVKNENTRGAKIIGINQYGKVVNSDISNEIINECLENQMTPGNKALELGTTITGDWLGISGASLTALTQTVYTTEFLNSFGGALTNVGLAAAFAQAVVDFQSGNDVALYGNLSKNLSYYSIGTWGSSALQLSFAGVYAIDYSINKFATEAWQGRDDIWYEAYKIYYESEGKRSAKEWYKKLYWMWQDSISGKNPGALSEQINASLDEYCNEFWNLPEEDIAYYQSEAMKGGFSGGGGLNTELKGKISRAKKAELVEVLQTPVFNRIESKISYYLKEQYFKELNDLKRQLNQIITVDIIEEVNADEKAMYGGYTIKFDPINENANQKNWTGKMKDDGTASTKFTILGHLQSGSPNTVQLYAPDKDPGVDEPDKIVSFKVNIPDTLIEIKKYPPFEEILGEWNGSLFFETVDVPENIPAGDEEEDDLLQGCDPALVATILKEYEGKTVPSKVIIEKTDENKGRMALIMEDTEQDDEPQLIDIEYKDGHVLGNFNQETGNVNIDLIAQYKNGGISLGGYIIMKESTMPFKLEMKFTSQR